MQALLLSDPLFQPLFSLYLLLSAFSVALLTVRLFPKRGELYLVDSFLLLSEELMELHPGIGKVFEADAIIFLYFRTYFLSRHAEHEDNIENNALN